MNRVKICSICGEQHGRRKVSYCYTCGRIKEMEVGEQMAKKQGPYYEKWKARWEAATGLKVKGGG